MPGPPFVFGACLALLAVLVALFIPDANGTMVLKNLGSPGKRRQRSRTSLSEYESGTDTQLMNQESVRLLSDDNKPA